MFLRSIVAAAFGLLWIVCNSSASEKSLERSRVLLFSDQLAVPDVLTEPGEESSAWSTSVDTLPLIVDRRLPDPGTRIEPVPHDLDVEGWDSLIGGRPSSEWQLLPQGLIYRAYLAGAKESRIRGVLHEDRHEGSLWDITLGGHIGLVRKGSMGAARPVGSQLDIECSAQLRLDRDSDEDMAGTDYRFGIPFTWGNEVYQTKFGYYHISSHAADEFLANNPGFNRINFVRETLIWGHSFYLEPRLRVYTEIGFAFLYDVSQPWEFQFGADYSPACGTGTRGAPFAAVNYHIRQELGYDGNIVGQFGWAWRSSPASGLLRLGLEYYNGRDEQFSFFRNSQNKLGLGAWYDY
jgi:hypothetical protein